MFELSKLLENTHYQRLTKGLENIVFDHIFVTDLLSTAIKNMGATGALITVIATQSTLSVASMLDLKLVVLSKDANVTEAFINSANDMEITVVKSTRHAHEIILDMGRRHLI